MMVPVCICTAAVWDGHGGECVELVGELSILYLVRSERFARGALLRLRRRLGRGGVDAAL